VPHCYAWDHTGVIYGFELDGTVTADFPIDKLGVCGPNGPEVGDIDGDGDLELAFVGGTGQVSIWDLPVAYHEPTTGWGALFHDDWNTNQYGFVPPEDLAAVPSEVPGIMPQLLAHPNPFNTRTTLSFSLSEWDAREAASGIYLAKLETARGSTSLRLLLLE
jgi:hypothetical protein